MANTCLTCGEAHEREHGCPWCLAGFLEKVAFKFNLRDYAKRH